MSSGQTPRTPIHFPRMKARGYRRRSRAVEREFRHYRPRYYISIVPDVGPIRSYVQEALQQLRATPTHHEGR